MYWINGHKRNLVRLIKLKMLKMKRRTSNFYHIYHGIIDLACIVFGVMFGFFLMLSFFF